MQAREVVTQEETLLTPQWGYWERKFQQWHKTDERCQMIIQLSAPMMTGIEAQNQRYITSPIKLPSVEEFWIAANDNVTHMAKIGKPITSPEKDNWKLNQITTP